MLKNLQNLFLIVIFIVCMAQLSGCTTAALGKPSLSTDVQSAVSSGHVSVYLDGTTAILSGRVDSLYDRNAAERVARRYEGVEQVINHIRIIDRVLNREGFFPTHFIPRDE